MDDDDEERSRSIPSRTKLGKRAATIEKFPYLGQPLILFGGLITIPFWAYRNTPIAMLDIMMADLPRVTYIDKEKITKRDIEEAERKTIELQKQTKTKGIGAKLNKLIDTKQYLQSKIKEE